MKKIGASSPWLEFEDKTMWQALIPLAAEIIGKVLPDPKQAADAKLEMLKLAQSGELAQLNADMQLALGQLKVNEVEAAAPDLFRGGWRPAVGWVCVAGLGYQFLAMPILPWAARLAGADVPPLPPIDMGTLMTLLAGMLGLGTLRTVEKVKGAA